MKRLLFVIVCMSFAVATAFGQVQGQGQGQGQRQGGGQGGQFTRLTPEESAKATTQRMNDSLKLTARQIAPIDSINLVFAKRQAKLMEDMGAGGDRTAMMESFTKLQEERTKAYEKVLTPAQMATYRKQEEARRSFGGQRPGGAQGGAPQRPN